MALSSTYGREIRHADTRPAPQHHPRGWKLVRAFPYAFVTHTPKKGDGLHSTLCLAWLVFVCACVSLVVCSPIERLVMATKELVAELTAKAMIEAGYEALFELAVQ
jgi:hypothetical protein